ncbi:MAG: hypothetical protein KC470_01185 [Dehalococcoidia bacterium]|nr:hypothetical protein [Dehalococcoidia bacterium]
MAEQRPIPVGIYELLTDFDAPKMSVRVFRLKEGKEHVDLHRHRISTQVYVALEGRAGIMRDGVEEIIEPHHAIEITPGVVHGARAVDGSAVVMNISVPALAADDQAPLCHEPHHEDYKLPLDGGDIDD